MTFIVGITAADGIVMCADRLESDTITNQYRAKLAVLTSPEWGVCWGSSGKAHTCDKLSQQMKQVLANKAYNRAAIETDVEVCLQYIKQNYDSQDGITIVLGLFGKAGQTTEFGLYRGASDIACLSLVKPYSIAGMDVSLANFLLDNMRNPFARVDETLRLGVHVTNVMKKYTSGVGGETDAFIYKLGEQWKPALSREIEAIEHQFTIEALEQHSLRFWLEHSHARLDSEILASDIAMRQIPHTKL